MLAVHQPGKRNGAADALSRDGNGGHTIAWALGEVRSAGMRTEAVAVPPEMWETLRVASGLPQRAKRRREGATVSNGDEAGGEEGARRRPASRRAAPQ